MDVPKYERVDLVMNNKSVNKFIQERQAKINKVIGQELTAQQLESFFTNNIGKKYVIHSGWSLNDLMTLTAMIEHAINRGIITNVTNDNNVLYVQLDNDRNYSEKFSLGSIKKMTYNKDSQNIYVIYNDNSYFRIHIS